jgi:hypothetical protein
MLKPSLVVRTYEMFHGQVVEWGVIYLLGFLLAAVTWRVFRIQGDRLMLSVVHLLTAIGFAVLVLGTATPRPESWQRLPRATLPARVGGDLPRVEVVDLRSLSPLDMDTITASVRKTGRCVVAHEAPVFAGLGAEIAARVTERCFYHLEAPVLRVGGFATPYPPSRLEEHYLPDLDRILDAVDRTFGY